MAQSVEVERIWFWDDDHWKGLRYLFEGEVDGVYGGGRGQEMSAGAAR
jgi:hypothetical protein